MNEDEATVLLIFRRHLESSSAARDEGPRIRGGTKFGGPSPLAQDDDEKQTTA
jgi:hypothetical protein